MELIRILLADDHTLFRDGLRSLLASVPEAEVVGEAATGTEAVDQAAALQPNVVLMDIQMPGINGIEATRRITSASPQIGVIVVTTSATSSASCRSPTGRRPSCGRARRGWEGVKHEDVTVDTFHISRVIRTCGSRVALMVW
jgi:CheY-like chemotaxis protein